jgi:hypothetical protein
MSPIVYGSGTGSVIAPIPSLAPEALTNPSAGLLSLEEWRESMHYNPWHFWGLAGEFAPVNSRCSTTVQKYAWQGADAAGRFDIVNAIITAEERLIPLMGFSTAPHYVEFTLPWPRYGGATNINWMGYANSEGRWENVQLPEGHVLAAGVETLDEIDLGAAVVFSDSDGDGLNDTFTVTVPLAAIVSTAEIAVYYSAADRLDGDAPLEKWRIRPLKVTVNAALMTATIKGRVWQIVKPSFYERPSGAELDAEDASNYVTTLDVYRRYTSSGNELATAQALFVWETAPYPLFCAYPTEGTDPAGIAYTYGRVGIRDAEKGIVTVGESVYDAATGTWSASPWFCNYQFRPPDRVIIRALCGVQKRVGDRVDDRMTRVVARLSAAEMARRICACEDANKEIYHWQFDLARTGGANSEEYGQIALSDLSNPLGTRRGQVYAWKEIKTNRQLGGFAV